MHSSDNGNVSSSGLDTSDKIMIGIGVLVGVASILAMWQKKITKIESGGFVSLLKA